MKKEILAPIVHEYVPQTVDLAHVNTRTDRVAALQGGRVFIVPQVILSEYLLFHEDFNKDWTSAFNTGNSLKHVDYVIVSIKRGVSIYFSLKLL